MATFNITTAQNWDELTSKAGGDTYNINGGTLTIDSDTRYGLNTTTTTGPGTAIAISATLGGSLEVDARKVRLVPYDGGSGNVPAGGTTITAGSASGKLICVMSALTAAPTAVGAAMPAAGFIKIKQWNDVAYADNTALGGLGGTVNGTDVVGWISLVNDEAGTITGRRLGLLRFRGAQYAIGTTSGSNATTWQLPTAGEAVYLPGVQVETDTGSGVYEWYPSAGSQTALLANVGTEAARGKVCWISSAGVLRFGHDGTNSTGGYVPPSGRNIRIPNVYMHSCTTAARGTNQVPHATLATRFEFVAAGAQITMDTVTCAWYMNLAQAYSVSLTDAGINDTIVCSELATAAAWSRVCVAPTQAQINTALTFSLNLAGGTIADSVFARYSLASSGSYVASLTDCNGWTLSSVQLRSLAATRGNATSGAATLIRANNTTLAGCTAIGGRVLLTTCATVTLTDLAYIDVPASTTPTANPMYAVDLGGGGCATVTVDGLTFAGLTLVQPYSGLLNVGAGTLGVKLRNIGTAASPLDLGGARLNAIAWTRASSTITVTSNSHGLKNSDSIYVIISADETTITRGVKAVTVTGTNTFTFTGSAVGLSSGTLSYYPVMAAYPILLAANAAANDVRVQRVYTTHSRSGPFSGDNSNKNVLYESLWADMIHAPVTAELNATLKGCVLNHALTAQTNPVYGSHWHDFYTTDCPANVAGVSWTRSTTTATITSTDHGLRTGDRVVVTVTSSAAAIVLGVKSITATTKDAFTFTCLNAGSASGTLTMVAENGKIAIAMNETTAESAAQVTFDAGAPNFTASGTLYMPVIGDQVTFDTPDYVLGHDSFPIDEAVMAAGTITNHDVTYAIDHGSGYSSYKNLSYPRAGGGGANASTTVTMTSTTGVAVDDYVFGTNIAPLAKVVSVDSGTNITVSIANVGTVSGLLRFNQLPNEAPAPSTGFRLKVRVKTTTTNVAAFSSLYVWTNSSWADRAHQYVLDTVPLTVTVRDVETGDPVENARVFIEATTGGPAPDGTDILTGLTDAAGVLTGVTEYIDQPVVGKVRRATVADGTLYKSAVISDTITDTGLSITVLMIPDE